MLIALAMEPLSTRDVELRSVDDPSPTTVGASLSSAREDSSGLRSRPQSQTQRHSAPAEELPTVELLGEEMRNWSLAVIVVGFVDVVLSGIIVIVSFSYAYRDNGVSLYTMGFQSFSHWLSSCLLIVRFRGELKHKSEETGQTALIAHRRRDLVREQVCSVTMGLLMLISAGALIFKAARKIRFWERWHLDHTNQDREVELVTEHLAWWGFSVYLLQAIFRCRSALKIQRPVLWHGFWCSVVSLLFLLILGIAAVNEKEWSWKAEPIAAILLAFVMIIEATRVLIAHLGDVDDEMRTYKC